MKIIGVGQINFWAGGTLWIGTSLAPIATHAHHAIQISIALKGTVRLKTAATGDWAAYRAAYIPSHHEHAFDAFGSTTATVFCEPESLVGRRLAERFGRGAVAEIPDAEATAASKRIADEYLSDASDEALNSAAREVLDELAKLSPTIRQNDPRIEKALAEIDVRLDQPITLEQIAAHVCLSPSRFRHLFADEVGVPFRPYILWRRLRHALECALKGASWTEAAHAANFADSAHLSRTFRRMLGVAPTALGRPDPIGGRQELADAGVRDNLR